MGRPAANRRTSHGKKRKTPNQNKYSFIATCKKSLGLTDLGSWFNQDQQWLDDDIPSASHRKICLPSEDIHFQYDSEGSDSEGSENEEVDASFVKLDRYVIIDPCKFQESINSSMVCRKCNGNINFYEKESFHHGLGTRLFFICENKHCSSHASNVGFDSTPKFENGRIYQINTASVLGLRIIGRGRTAASKLFSVLNIGAPLSQPSWSKHTDFLTKKTSETVERNMQLATSEVKEILTKHHELSSPRIVNSGTSFDCSWNSRGWQARDGIVAAIAQETGKIIDIVHKSSSCPTCKAKQTLRDRGEMTTMQYLEWFIEHESSCYLNHSGSPQVSS